MNPQSYPPYDVELFDFASNWIVHDGTGCPVAPDQYVKVMYSNGFVASKVRVAYAWTNWTGGRDWWLKPEPEDRLWIIMYCVV